ncbi:MAG: Gfo/Idh/MocA family oxidoreductase [Gemmataceae bacterium]|nr:Gfo/Idh/MocA family oxidoreductase [Gemmataceae bacterium]
MPGSQGEIRFGLIGYGAWGSHHARAIEKTPGAILAAICAKSESSRKTALENHPTAVIYANLHDLVARPDLDIIDVVLPSYLHLEAGKAALGAGKHLLMEKPLALTAAECLELKRLAEVQQKLLAVGFELRLSELWGQAKRILDSGEIGEARYGFIELWRRPYRQGAEGWRYDISRVGNWVLEEPVHFFDLARWYFSAAGEPVSLFAQANSIQPGHPELNDNFSACLQFGNGSYCLISQTLAAYGHTQTAKITGAKGALWASWSGAMDRDPKPTASLKVFNGIEVREAPLNKPTGELFELEEEIAAVVKAVRGQGNIPASAFDGLRAVELCEAAQDSIRQGKVVKLS